MRKDTQNSSSFKELIIVTLLLILRGVYFLKSLLDDP